ncbi:hypothetical protein KQX54_010240 [Cotesia glomerata]|uniref:Uncharacterized protein n=1 Tax=Cotesia glomerata TaxID=32391 RepID=A0AAV7INX3_COTGL|nr:hypothetical protein KQX54_010240 [Cotesia glomerata]
MFPNAVPDTFADASDLEFIGNVSIKMIDAMNNDRNNALYFQAQCIRGHFYKKSIGKQNQHIFYLIN